MSTLQINGGATIDYSPDWTTFKNWINGTNAYFSFAYSEDSVSYTVIVQDGLVFRVCSFNKSTSDATDFETNYKSYGNRPSEKGNFDDPRLLRRFGNITTASTSEILVSQRAYTEQASGAQRSVQSSSVQDKSGGTGSVAVRITYLDTNYVLKTEDLNLNGTNKVNTTNTDIRFIERFEVIQGPPAVGAISLMDGTTGGASEFCGISAATTEAFLCHHYVPAGKKAWIINWGATGDDEIKLKLNGQNRFGNNLVASILDLENLMANNPAALTTVEFSRDLKGVLLTEKTYMRITVVPNQATSTITRAYMTIFEDFK